ncbi:cytochrome P450 [Artomyces pyxidatus]|uniref:Cytochrome P450 n=1 Tax=Artomyces pyxidatus TaxID=48021 RepID=A0ACB8ST22_9AGAM|nr:cytochrome P450 [Artomyces pyxidatus]
MVSEQGYYGFPSTTWLATLPIVIGFTVAMFSLGRHRIRQRVLWHVPGPASPSFLTGNFLQMFDPISGVRFREHVRKTYGSVSRFNGPLGDQILMISDPKALSSILVKTQDVFDMHQWFIELFRHAVGPGLFSSTGAIHRRQRKAFNPIFSSAHMRSIVPLFHRITDELLDALQRQVTGGPREIEMMDWLGRVALELISQGGLGHTFDSFKPDAGRNDFKEALKDFMPVTGRLYVFLLLFPLISKWPSKVLRFAAACSPISDVRYLVKLTNTMHNNAKQLFQTKRALLEKGDAHLVDQISGGKDIISMFMRSNSNATNESKMKDEEVMAQMITLMGAGTETVSNALARIVHLLCEHQDVQGKLREELNGAGLSTGGELGYDELLALPYLDAIYRETMRLHPPATFSSRVSLTDATIALSRPLYPSATSNASLFIPRNTSVIVDILSVNCDPDIWGADADTWKPERWLSPLPESVADACIPGVYSNMLTFAGGSRSCIGYKLAEIEMKVVLSRLVRLLRFSPSKSEIVWKLGHVTTPSVKGSNAITPMMPMVLEKI